MNCSNSPLATHSLNRPIWCVLVVAALVWGWLLICYARHASRRHKNVCPPLWRTRLGTRQGPLPSLIRYLPWVVLVPRASPIELRPSPAPVTAQHQDPKLEFFQRGQDSGAHHEPIQADSIKATWAHHCRYTRYRMAFETGCAESYGKHACPTPGHRQQAVTASCRLISIITTHRDAKTPLTTAASISALRPTRNLSPSPTRSWETQRGRKSALPAIIHQTIPTPTAQRK